jgi:hypothetical protein
LFAWLQILGIIMTAVGSAGMSNQYASLAGETLPTGVLVLGIFVMIISIVGCCGAKRENRVILGVVCCQNMNFVDMKQSKN